MAQKKTKTTKKKSISNKKSKDYNLTNQQKLIFGSFLIIMGVLLCLSFISYFFTGNADQSIISEFTSRDIKAENWLNKVGAWTSDVLVRRGFGLSSFLFSGLIFISGIYVLLNIKKARLGRHWFWGTLIMIWSSILFGFISPNSTLLGGIIGNEISAFFMDYIGVIGVSMMLFFCLILYFAIRFKCSVAHITKYFSKAKKEINVLCAEDNPTSLKFAYHILSLLGCKVHCATCGEQAVWMMRQIEFDIIYMDLHMPGMNGYEATKWIRNEMPVHKKPAVLAITGDTSSGVTRRCITAGMEGAIHTCTTILSHTSLTLTLTPPYRLHYKASIQG